MTINKIDICVKYLATVSVFIFFNYSYSFAQIGGLYTYDFLNLSPSARATALSGYTIAIADEDIAQAFANPALINEKMSHHISINHNFHFADISYGNMAYGLNLPGKDISIMVGGSYINYGSFKRADVFGNLNGTFSSSESAFIIGASKQLDERLRMGLNIKYVHSRFDTYGSSGIGADLGVHYFNPQKRSNWAIVLKNIGGQLSSFDLKKEAFPFDLQIGFAKRLAHLPFRFMITAHHLQKWNLRSTLDDRSNNIFIGQASSSISNFSKTVDNFFRHLAFGGELLIGQNEVVRIRLGYNHLRNKELSVDGIRSLSGFSFGFGIKVKRMQFDYGAGRYHLAGGVNHLSVSFDLDSLFGKL